VSPFGPSFFPQPRVYSRSLFLLTTHHSLPTSRHPFVFITIQIPFPVSPCAAHPYKTPGVSPLVHSYSGSSASVPRCLCGKPHSSRKSLRIILLRTICTPEKVNSFAIKEIQTLFAKCRGGCGYPGGTSAPFYLRSLCALSTFKINTCKSVSKQMTLTPFRMNTCEKTGGGGWLRLT
jgi:hypothetical protein